MVGEISPRVNKNPKGYLYSGSITKPPTATGEKSIVIGDGSSANDVGGDIILGANNYATMNRSIILGHDTTSSNYANVIIRPAYSGVKDGTALFTVSGYQNLIIGHTSSDVGSGSVSGNNNVFLGGTLPRGSGGNISGGTNIFIGTGLNSTSNAFNKSNNIMIGNGTAANNNVSNINDNVTSFGTVANLAMGQYSITLGVLGGSACANGTGGIAIGRTAKCASSGTNDYSIAIGYSAVAPTGGLQISVNNAASTLEMSSTGQIYQSAGTNRQIVLTSYASGSEPTAYSDGALIYDSTNNRLKLRASGAWKQVAHTTDAFTTITYGSTINVGVQTVVYSYTAASNPAVIFYTRASGSDGSVHMGVIRIATNGTTVNVSADGNETSTFFFNYDAVINGANVDVKVTPVGYNSTNFTAKFISV